MGNIRKYAIFINGGYAKKQWDRVHASEAYETLLHCFPLFSCLISLACMHLVPLFYACPPFMNMVYRRYNLKKKFMFKVMYCRAPEYIKDLFRPKEQITSLVLRDDGNKLAVPFRKTDCLNHSISYSGAILWNNLPKSQCSCDFFSN